MPATAAIVTTDWLAVAAAVLVAAAQDTAVVDVHDVVLHVCAPEAAAVAVQPYEAKFSPEIVTVPDPELPMLIGEVSLMIGASKLKARLGRVPTTAATVTVLYCTASVLAPAITHPRLVADNHEVELHMSTPHAAAEAVVLYGPKLIPESVSTVAPVMPLFTAAWALSTGVSKLNGTLPRVPTNVPTVTMPYATMSVLGSCSTHARVVDDVHEVELHMSTPLADAEAVALYGPKLSPESVTTVLPDVAPLCVPKELASGASRVNALVPCVPTTLPTVTSDGTLLRLAAAPIRHCAAVAEDQAAVLHATSCTACTVGVKPCVPKFSPVTVTVAPPVRTALTGAS